MVNSSLLEYLKTKTEIEKKILKTIIFENREPQEDYSKENILSAISKLKILDPACGSGAFPMGILQKLMKILTLIDEDASIWFRLQKEEFKETHKHRNKNYIRKLSIIKNSIFGVDIQPIAIEISKLRFFLSLIVEEEGEPEPLPNLEFKFACANSLLPLYKGKTDQYKQFVKELQDLRDEYFVSSGQRKKEIIELYTNKRNNYFQSLNHFAQVLGSEEIVSTDIIDYNPFDPISVAGFFDSDFMFNIKEGFDIVIGNPPYIRHEKIKELKPLLQKSSYRSYNGTADIYIYFFEQGYKLLRDNGILSYITSNKYTRAKYGKEFREFVLANTKILEYIDFNGVKVFESATVDTSILSYQKAISEKSDFIYCDVDKSYQKGESLETFVGKKGFDYLQSDLSVESFSFANPQELAIKKRIEAIGIPLKDWDIKINYGIKTGFNEAFIIDGKIKDELITKDPKSSEIIKPILRGRDIKKYGYEFADKWLINSHNNPPIDINDYSAIKEHLDKYYEKLEKRSDKGATPYNLRSCAFLDDFEKEKIVYPDIGNLSFCFDDKKMYFNNTVYFLNSDSKYILAVLNSKIISYYYNFISSSLGNGGNRAFKIFIEQLPIPQISKEAQKPFEILVDYVMFLKTQNLKEKGIKYQLMPVYFEQIIDGMVYELYFEELLKKHDRDIIQHLGVLPEITELADEEKISILFEVFTRLNNIKHKVRNNLFYMDSIPEIKIIKGK